MTESDKAADESYRTRRRRLWFLWILIALPLIVLGWYGFVTLLLGGIYLGGEAGKVSTTLKWGRLDPFPASKSEFSIKAGGSIFTRSFRTRFKAPLADIRAWLASSPGTKDIQPERKGPKLRYIIAPGGGADWAEVNVDEDQESVEVYVYWS